MNISTTASEDYGVSSVVGVVILLMITVILVTIFGIAVGNLLSDNTDPNSKVNAEFNYLEIAEIGGEKYLVFEVTKGAAFSPGNVYLYVSNHDITASSSPRLAEMRHINNNSRVYAGERIIALIDSNISKIINSSITTEGSHGLIDYVIMVKSTGSTLSSGTISVTKASSSGTKVVYLHEHDSMVFNNPVNSSSIYSMKKGNYYLENDITLTRSLNVESTINLCLNNYTITASSGYEVFVIKNGGILTIYDCGGNGGIYGGGSSTSAIKVELGKLNIFSGTIENFYATNGSGIYNNGTVTIYHGKISNCVAKYGGGIYNSKYGTVTLEAGAIISNNNATNDGGGIYNEGILTIYGSPIQYNNATNDGGGIYNEGILTIYGSPIQYNNATNDGGGIYNAGNSSFTNAKINNNTATNDGGGIYTTKFSVFSTSEINQNTASRYGGGIYLEQPDYYPLNLSDGNIMGNSASNGGGIYNKDGKINLIYSKSPYLFSSMGIQNDKLDNFLINGTDDSTTLGLDVVNFTKLLDEIVIRNNNATSRGGGIYNNGGSVMYNNATISNTTATITVPIGKILVQNNWNSTGIDNVVP